MTNIDDNTPPEQRAVTEQTWSEAFPVPAAEARTVPTAPTPAMLRAIMGCDTEEDALLGWQTALRVAPVAQAVPDAQPVADERALVALAVKHHIRFPRNKDLIAFVDEARAALAAPQPAAQPAAFGDEDHVLVPRGLLGSACSVIDKQRDGTKTLAELRRYTTGDLSQAARSAPTQQELESHKSMLRNAISDLAAICDALGLDDNYNGPHEALSAIKSLAAQQPADAAAFRLLVAAGNRMDAGGEEFEGPDGMAVSIGLDYWHDFADALERAQAALAAQPTGRVEYDGSHVESHCAICNECESECACDDDPSEQASDGPVAAMAHIATHGMPEPDARDIAINDLIRTHGYSHPLAIAARLEQCVQRAGETTAGLTMYEAMKVLRIAGQAQQDALTQAMRDVLDERTRQIAIGYDADHDDEHASEEIAAVAAYYVMPDAVRGWPASETGYGETWGEAIVPEGWHADAGQTRRTQLVMGAAMALAEIERLDRAARQGEGSANG